MSSRPSSAARLATGALLWGGLVGWAAAAAGEVSFHQTSLELPGAPAALLPADFDGDGVRDLAIVVVYTGWEQIGIEEETEMDQVEGLVEVLTIVPTLMDHREVRLYLGRPGGGYEAAGEPLPLPLSVLTLEPGPPGIPALAVTDQGASALRYDAASRSLAFEPLVADPPVLAGTGAFLAGLGLVRDATGDGVSDLLLPTAAGIDLFRGTGRGLAGTPAARIALPTWAEPTHRQRSSRRPSATLDYPLPDLRDLDGDGRPDLVFADPTRGLERLQVVRHVDAAGEDDRFAPPQAIVLPGRRHHGDGDGDGRRTERSGATKDDGKQHSDHHEPDIDPVYLGALAPAAPGEPAWMVLARSLDDEDAGPRKAMRQVREPRFRIELHRVRPDGVVAPAAERAFEVTGFVRTLGSDVPIPGGFQDLNGDGRLDLISVTDDLSLFKAVSVLATKHLKVELGFHAWCQQPDGGFRPAPGAPMTSQVRIDLNDLELRRRSLFAGDFDGDGRSDFVELGGRREIGIHLGRADCSYPERPDATIRLRDPVRDLGLVAIRDLDGDGRSDLAVTHPQTAGEAGVTSPVRLDLYLSRSTP